MAAGGEHRLLQQFCEEKPNRCCLGQRAAQSTKQREQQRLGDDDDGDRRSQLYCRLVERWLGKISCSRNCNCKGQMHSTVACIPESASETTGFTRIFLVRAVAKGGVQGECGITLEGKLLVGAFVYLYIMDRAIISRLLQF